MNTEIIINSEGKYLSRTILETEVPESVVHGALIKIKDVSVRRVALSADLICQYGPDKQMLFLQRFDSIPLNVALEAKEQVVNDSPMMVIQPSWIADSGLRREIPLEFKPPVDWQLWFFFDTISRECFLFLAGSGGVIRKIPIANVFGNGQCCLGDAPEARSPFPLTQFEGFRKQMLEGSYNADLTPVQNLVMWDPDTCEQIPFLENWEVACPPISLVAYNDFLRHAAEKWGLMSVPAVPTTTTVEEGGPTDA